MNSQTPPRFHTPRNPNNRTFGPAIGKLSAALGAPLQPWQQRAADVATEIDAAGRFIYDTVLVSVPRQSGKTKLAMAVALHRAICMPDARVWTTAQTGQAARERWIKELATPAARTLGPVVTIKRGAGDTRLIIPATGSECRPMPPTADYLHGEQSDLVMIDEAWSHSESDGAALMQAIEPTMATRPNPQTWFLSTKGTAASTWWHSRLDAAIEDTPPGVCVIDYGISADTDPTNIDAVIAAHPAVGGIISPRAVHKAARTLTPSEFARGYGNIATGQNTSIIEAAALDAVITDTPLDAGPVKIGVAVSWQTDLTAVTVAGRIDGTPAIEVIAARPGQAWAVDFVASVQRAHGSGITIDPHGPSRGLADKLTDLLGDSVTLAKVDDVIQGTDGLLEAIRTQDIALRRDDALTAEISGAALRTIGDKGRLFSRKHSLGSIARLESTVLAYQALTGARRTMPAPIVWSPSV